MIMNYSSKQTDIINATMDILDSGKELNKITVKEIADFAGIGKGSVYDHFQSKEDIIHATILKKFQDGFYNVDIIMKQHLNFKNKIYALYDLMSTDIKSDSSLSVLNLLTSAKSIVEIHDVFKKGDFCLVDKFSNIISDILYQGIEENVISPKIDILYIHMAIFSNLSALSRFITASHFKLEENDENIIKDNAYKMLLKTLN